MTAVVFLTYIFGAFMENREKFAFAFVFCALIFALSSLTVLYNIKPASKFAKNVDKKTGQLIRDITGRDPFHGDISDGDSVILDKKYMDIYVDKLPEEVLYLKNFSSGDYSNGRWLEDTDDAIYKSIAYEEGWQKYEDMLEPMVESEFFTLNDTLENKKRTNAIKLKEEKSGILDEQVCRPYYGKKEYKWKNKLISSEARVFKLFQMKDIDFTWEEASEKEWTARVFEKYVPKAKEVYTEYPSDGLERLSALKSPYSGAKEVTAYIVHILNDNAIYTLEPGKADGNYDINEYFLFENHRGYCEQYASAATLIYRVNGIPARYVTGYHIMPNTFLDAPDGTYMTTLTDRHAHSWVEILTEEYGWVPVDVTPDASGVIHATFPGFSEENLSNLMEERGWKRIRTAAAGTFEGTDDEEEEEEAEEESLQYEGENRLIYLLPFGAVLLFSVALKYLLFPLKKRKALKLCQGMRDMLIFSGLSPKCDVSDERFKNAIYQTEGGENIYPCILKAYYSEEGCNEKENLILFYKALKKKLKKKSGVLKKIFIEILY
ncbi:MAG: transglutaminase domain-containing protein [Firmicutes bacterium]|nr:transglutaminase domain-containing protein [Bacillota bacterium]